MWPRHINYSKTHETDPPRQALFGANVSEVTDRGSVWAMTLLHEFTGRSFKWIEMPNRGEKSNTLVRTILNILTSDFIAERHFPEAQILPASCCVIYKPLQTPSSKRLLKIWSAKCKSCISSTLLKLPQKLSIYPSVFHGTWG